MLRLVGVGVGPGDPELLTVKAVRLLREADLVLVPVMDLDDPVAGRAESSVRAHLGDDPRIRRVPFALNDVTGRSTRRTSAWDAAAETVLEAFVEGAATVAFATIGDPSVYSTFSYLAQTVTGRRPDVSVEFVPGITAMQDLAARSGTTLCEGTETLALFPMTAGLPAFEHALETFDTVVAYKGGRRLPQIREVLRRRGRLEGAVLGTHLGLEDELVGPVTAVDAEARAPYLSTLIVPAARTARGARL